MSGPMAARAVPRPYWALLAIVFAVASSVFFGYGFRYHNAWEADSYYYTTLTLTKLGHSLPDAAARTAAWFHVPAFATPAGHDFLINPQYKPLLTARVLYPLLSAPFVALFGIGGMWVVPLACCAFVTWGVMRLLSRVYRAELGLVVTLALLVSVGFWRYLSAAMTEGLATALMVGILLLLPLGPARRRWGPHGDAVAVAVLIVALGLTRQAQLVPLGMITLAYLWTALRERRWRNAWLRFELWSLGAFLVSTGVSQLYAAYDPLHNFLAVNGLRSVRQVPGALPDILGRIMSAELTSYFTVDVLTLALYTIALLLLVWRWRSTAAALFLGALLPSAAIAFLDGVPTGWRYYAPMLPVVAFAVAAFGAELRRVARSAPAEAADPVDTTADPARQVQPNPADQTSSPSAASASDSQPGGAPARRAR